MSHPTGDPRRLKTHSGLGRFLWAFGLALALSAGSGSADEPDFEGTWLGIHQAKGPRKALVVCMDLLRDGEERPSRAYLQAMLQGGDGGPNVAGWLAENSNGTASLDIIDYLGCDDDDPWLAPEAHRGTWAWDSAGFGQLWVDAIQMADPQVDWHAYDTNGDGLISGDELGIFLVRPQNAPYGTNRSVSVAVDENPDPLGFHILDLYVSAKPENRLWTVGLISHEFMHATGGALDLYSGLPTDPGGWSIMSSHFSAPHLDPLHKLKFGWLGEQTFAIPPDLFARWYQLYNHDAVVVYDPDKGRQEYFVVECRRNDSDTYDRVQPASGIALWHIVEDGTLSAQPPSGVDPGTWAQFGADRHGVRFLGLLAKSEHRDLVWADGSDAGVSVLYHSEADGAISVFLGKPAPPTVGIRARPVRVPATAPVPTAPIARTEPASPVRTGSSADRAGAPAFPPARPLPARVTYGLPLGEDARATAPAGEAEVPEASAPAPRGEAPDMPKARAEETGAEGFSLPHRADMTAGPPRSGAEDRSAAVPAVSGAAPVIPAARARGQGPAIAAKGNAQATKGSGSASRGRHRKSRRHRARAARSGLPPSAAAMRP